MNPIQTIVSAGTLVAVVASLLSSPAAGAESARQQPTVECTAAAITPPPDTTITSVRALTSPVNYCRVDGYVTTSNPGPNTVGFSVALPDDWNGRYLMVIPGGAGGFIAEPGDSDLLRGYAAATTDKGSHSQGLDLNFRKDPAKDTDYAHRGVHVTTVTTQAITAQYYQQKKFGRYITGCSGGGISTLAAAIMYPEDADAFIPGATSPSGYAVTQWGYIVQYIQRDKNRWISADDMRRAGEVILAKFDAADGAKDGLIWDPSKIILARDMFPFLTDVQYMTLQHIASEMPAPKGLPDVRAPGYWLAEPAPLARSFMGSAPPPWTKETQPLVLPGIDTIVRSARGPNFDFLTDMNFSDPKQMAEEKQIITKTPGWFGGIVPANLARAKDLGRKVIMYAGVSDEAAPPSHMADFYNGVAKKFGPATEQFTQLYLVPGMVHCRAGERGPSDVVDKLLETAEQWVEQGRAPEQVIVSNRLALSTRGMPGPGAMPPEFFAKPNAPLRTFHLCPYPLRSIFKGGLDNPQKLEINDASNWSCQK